jgi:hydroxymethylglutaryl-CoA synthase
MNHERVGIEALSFYTPRYYLDLATLAGARGVDVNKYRAGIGQEKMSIPPPDEDIVTMGASAAHSLGRDGRLEEVDLVLFATESGVDQSKAAGIFVHGLLDLPSRCRCVELKQACYSATAGIQMAAAMVQRGASRKALVIASDIARYDLGSPGEATQGAGALAMIVSPDPALLALDPEAGAFTDDVMDFWRPNYRHEALVDGKYSTQVYIRALLESWDAYREVSGRSIEDFARFCYHIPFTRMAAKAHRQLWKHARGEAPSPDDVDRPLEESLRYSREAGNCYAASMYVGLASLLDTADEDLAGNRIGFFSYGSGCVGEFFSGVVQPGYEDAARAERHRNLLDDRTELSYQQYEDIYNLAFPEDGGDHTFAQYRTGPYRLAGISQHKRLYEKLEDVA